MTTTFATSHTLSTLNSFSNKRFAALLREVEKEFGDNVRIDDPLTQEASFRVRMKPEFKILHKNPAVQYAQHNREELEILRTIARFVQS